MYIALCIVCWISNKDVHYSINIFNKEFHWNYYLAHWNMNTLKNQGVQAKLNSSYSKRENARCGAYTGLVTKVMTYYLSAYLFWFIYSTSPWCKPKGRSIFILLGASIFSAPLIFFFSFFPKSKYTTNTSKPLIKLVSPQKKPLTPTLKRPWRIGHQREDDLKAEKEFTAKTLNANISAISGQIRKI